MRLFRFEYSCYARKVQMLLDLMGIAYEVCEVPFGDRTELVGVTGGYVQVPVLVDGSAVVVDSKAICEYLLSRRATSLLPPPWQALVWAYADWCDGPLEDILFRLAAPGIRGRFARSFDAALFTFIKERKFGRGCVEDWARDHDALLQRGRALLAPTAATLRALPFICGEQPTLADAALYGQCAMVQAADRSFVGALAAELPAWMARLEGHAGG